MLYAVMASLRGFASGSVEPDTVLKMSKGSEHNISHSSCRVSNVQYFPSSGNIISVVPYIYVLYYQASCRHRSSPTAAHQLKYHD
jgi:hypothetical protein